MAIDARGNAYSMSNHLTLTEAQRNFVQKVDYLARVTASAGPVNLVLIRGIARAIMDTTPGSFTINLPDISSGSEKYRVKIMNIGTNVLTIDPGAATINGIPGVQIIPLKYYGMTLKRRGANWIVTRRITPS